MKEYFRKPYMTQGITKHEDYMKAIPQRAIDVQGQIAPNIEFKKPYDYHPNTAQMIHYYANNLHYLGGDPVPPLNDPSLLPHAPVTEVPMVEKTGTITVYPVTNTDDCQWNASFFYDGVVPNFALGYDQNGSAGTAYVRFSNIKIPQGSTINSAILTFFSGLNTGTTALAVKIYGNAVDNSSPPTSVATGNALVKTTAAIDWDVTESWAVNTSHVTPDISTVIKEVVGRSGWKSGNALGIIIPDDSGVNLSHYAQSFNDGVAIYYPKLVVSYTGMFPA